MKQSYLIPILLSPLFIGCGDSPQIENSRPDPNPTPRPEITDFYVSPANTGCVMEMRTQPGGGIEAFIGHGYDVTGDYLAPSSIRSTVVDVSKLPDDAYTVFVAPAYNSGETFLGEDAGSLLSDLMAGLGEGTTPSGSDYYFVGTLSNSSSNSSFVFDTQWQRALIAGFPGLSTTVKDALSDEFIADMSLLSADGLVRKYGTHFISRGSAGIAIREIYSAYLPTAANGLSPLREGFNAAAASIAGNYNGILSDKLASLYNYGARLQVTFCGGNTDIVKFDEVTSTIIDNETWGQSGDHSNYALIDISGLQPLSVAIADKDLASRVDAASRRYIKESQSKLEPIVPLFQNTNGLVYRYVTSAEASTALDKTGIRSYGVLGALSSVPTEEATLPLYSYVASSEGNQILSLIQPTDEWKRLGYVMKTRTETSIPLYEISDGTRFAYTIEATNSYGKNNQWHPTGAVFYLLRP